MLEKKFEIDCNLLAKRDPLEIAVNDNLDDLSMQYSDLLHTFCDDIFKEMYAYKKDNSILRTGLGTKEYLASIYSKENPDVCLETENNNGLFKTRFIYNPYDENSEKVIHELNELFELFSSLKNGKYSEIPRISDEPVKVFDSIYYGLTVYKNRIFMFEKEGGWKFFRYC